MNIKRRIATSRSTLPIVSTLALAVWGAAYLLSPLPTNMVQEGDWMTRLAAFVIAVFLMVTLNNSYALMRVFSRMVSTTFIFLTCAGGLFYSLPGSIITLCTLGYFLSAFRLYQNKNAGGWALSSFLCLGIASVVWVQMLYLVIPMLLITHIVMQSLSWRNLSGSIMGLIIPYWVLIPMAFVNDMPDILRAHFLQLTEGVVFFDRDTYLSCWKLGNTIFASLLFIIFSISSFHFLHYAYEEKIKNRMTYNVFMLIALSIFIALLLQPQHFEFFIRMVIVASSPVIAHYITFSKSKISSVTTLIFTILLWISCFLYLSNMAIWDSSLQLS